MFCVHIDGFVFIALFDVVVILYMDHLVQALNLLCTLYKIILTLLVNASKFAINF